MSRASRTHQRPLRTLIVFAVVTAFLFAIMAFNNIWKPKLGLDLKGGTTITLTATNVSGSGAVDPDSLETARTIIQQRVDAIGVGESGVTTAGENQITVAVPNVAPDTLTEMVGQTAQLYFRPVLALDIANPNPQPTVSVGPEGEADQGGSEQAGAGDETEGSLPKPAPSPRPTESGEALGIDEALAYKPSQQDLDEFASFKCGDEFPDLLDQPLLTCDREGQVKYLLGPTVIPGDMLTQASAGMRQGA